MVYKKRGRIYFRYTLGAVDTQTYTYDPAGNVTQLAGLATATYTYDALHRLLAEQSPTVTRTFTYDPNGHRLSDGTATATYVPQSNRLATLDGVAVSHDAAGNLTTSGKNHSGQSSLILLGGGAAIFVAWFFLPSQWGELGIVFVVISMGEWLLSYWIPPVQDALDRFVGSKLSGSSITVQHTAPVFLLAENKALGTSRNTGKLKKPPLTFRSTYKLLDTYWRIVPGKESACEGRPPAEACGREGGGKSAFISPIRREE